MVLPTLVSACRLRTSIVTALSSLRLVLRQVPAPLLPYHSQPHRDCLPLFPDSALVTPQCRSITKLEAAAGVLPAASPLRLSRVLLQLRSPRFLQTLSILPHHHPALWSGAQVLPTLVSACRLRTSIVTAISSRSLAPLQVLALPSLSLPHPHKVYLPPFPGSVLVTPQCKSIIRLDRVVGALRD